MIHWPFPPTFSPSKRHPLKKAPAAAGTFWLVVEPYPSEKNHGLRQMG